MKTIGLIGGTTWLSTVDYYTIINQKVNEKLGGDSSAKIILYSVDFAVIRKLAEESKWDEISEGLCPIARILESAGADCLVLCANTLHIVANDIRKSINIPLIHIVEETANQIKNKGLHKVVLLGTRFTMEEDFYKRILSENQIEPMIPDKVEREFIHNSIFDELQKEIFKPETKKRYLDIIDKLKQNGAEGIILGCTEIPLIIKQDDCDIPLFNTTLIHASAIVDYALND